MIVFLPYSKHNKMGTRTNIRFIRKNYRSKKQLYIHNDGYLSFVGKKLFEMMQEYNKNNIDSSTNNIINMCKNMFDECEHPYEVECNEEFHGDLEFTYTVVIDSKNNMEIDVGFVYGKSEYEEDDDNEEQDEEYFKYFMDKPDKKYSVGFITK